MSFHELERQRVEEERGFKEFCEINESCDATIEELCDDFVLIDFWSGNA